MTKQIERFFIVKVSVPLHYLALACSTVFHHKLQNLLGLSLVMVSTAKKETIKFQWGPESECKLL